MCFAKLDIRCRLGTGPNVLPSLQIRFSKQVVLLARKDKKGLSLFSGRLKRRILKPAWLLPCHQDFRKIKVMDSEEYNFRRSFMLLPSLAIS